MEADLGLFLRCLFYGKMRNVQQQHQRAVRRAVGAEACAERCLSTSKMP